MEIGSSYITCNIHGHGATNFAITLLSVNSVGLCGTCGLGFSSCGLQARKYSVGKPALLCVVCFVYTAILINYFNCFNFVLLFILGF